MHVAGVDAFRGSEGEGSRGEPTSADQHTLVRSDVLNHARELRYNVDIRGNREVLGLDNCKEAMARYLESNRDIDLSIDSRKVPSYPIIVRNNRALRNETFIDSDGKLFELSPFRHSWAP
jgi:hypothetical protein